MGNQSSSSSSLHYFSEGDECEFRPNIFSYWRKARIIKCFVNTSHFQIQYGQNQSEKIYRLDSRLAPLYTHLRRPEPIPFQEKKHYKTALHRAAHIGDLEICKELSQSFPSWITLPDEKRRTPVHFAVIAGHFEVVKFMVKLKRQLLRCVDNNGRTIWKLAQEGDSSQVSTDIRNWLNQEEEKFREEFVFIDRGCSMGRRLDYLDKNGVWTSSCVSSYRPISLDDGFAWKAETLYGNTCIVTDPCRLAPDGFMTRLYDPNIEKYSLQSVCEMDTWYNTKNFVECEYFVEEKKRWMTTNIRNRYRNPDTGLIMFQYSEDYGLKCKKLEVVVGDKSKLYKGRYHKEEEIERDRQESAQRNLEKLFSFIQQGTHVDSRCRLWEDIRYQDLKTYKSPQYYQWTILHASANSGLLTVCEYILNAVPSLCFAKDEFGRTPIHLSTKQNHTEVCKLFTKIFPCIILEQDNHGQTPLEIVNELATCETYVPLCRHISSIYERNQTYVESLKQGDACDFYTSENIWRPARYVRKIDDIWYIRLETPQIQETHGKEEEMDSIKKMNRLAQPKFYTCKDF